MSRSRVNPYERLDTITGDYSFESPYKTIENRCRINHNEKWITRKGKVLSLRYWPSGNLCFGHYNVRTCTFKVRSSFRPSRAFGGGFIENLVDFTFTKRFIFIATKQRIERVNPRSGYRKVLLTFKHRFDDLWLFPELDFFVQLEGREFGIYNLPFMPWLENQQIKEEHFRLSSLIAPEEVSYFRQYTSNQESDMSENGNDQVQRKSQNVKIRSKSCAQNHCLNGGLCEVSGNVKSCLCRENFTGEICQYRSFLDNFQSDDTVAAKPIVILIASQ